MTELPGVIQNWPAASTGKTKPDLSAARPTDLAVATFPLQFTLTA